MTDPHQRIERAVARLETSSIVDGSVEGCSGAEIEEIDSAVGVTLPDAYVAFLRRMGRSAGTFLRGDDLFYLDDIPRLQDTARDLTDDTNVELPDDAVVFLGHHDYVFLYFRPTDPDPPVYRYLDGEDELERVHGTFSAWLSNAVEDELELSEH